MPLRSTFEIGTQIILLKIDGFLKGWILNITPLKYLPGIKTKDLSTEGAVVPGLLYVRHLTSAEFAFLFMG